MKMDRLLAYSPNLKQSWMLIAIILVCTLIAVATVSRVMSFVFVGVRDIEVIATREWIDLFCDLIIFAVAVVSVIALDDNSSYTPVVSPRQPLLLWLLLAPFILSVGWSVELLTMWIPKFDIFAGFFNTRFQNNLPRFLSAVIVLPIFVEWLHRGIILKGLLTHYSALKAIVWSSVIFSVMLCVPSVRGIISVFCFGLVVGWIYWRTRSLWLCIFMHVVNNAVVFLIRCVFPNATDTTLADLAGGYYIYAVALLVCAFAGVWINKVIIPYEA